MNLHCPKCEKDFDCEDWESGECPYCKKKYIVDEICAEDYSDCWPYIEWEE
jgi:hypothetical protein